MGRTIVGKLSLVLMLAGACASPSRELAAKQSEDAGADAESSASNPDDTESQPSDAHDDAAAPQDAIEDAGTHHETDVDAAPFDGVPTKHTDEAAPPHPEDPAVSSKPALDPLPALPHPREGVCAFLPPADPSFHVDNVNCPDGVVHGNVSFQSDADVEKLHGCTRIHGHVNVYAAHVSSLAALDALQVIDGSLYVSVDPSCDTNSTSCSPLATLAGLEKLSCIGDGLSVIAWPRPLAIDALHNLVEIGGGLTIAGAKDSDAAFTSLRRVWGNVSIDQGTYKTPRLEAVYGTMNLNDGNDASIYVGCSEGGNYCRDGVLGCNYRANTESDLARLSNCEIALGNLYVAPAALENLSALKNLRYVKSILSLSGNSDATVTTLAGLESLQSVWGMDVGVPSLTSLAALKNVRFENIFGTDIGSTNTEAPSGDLWLAGLSKLASLKGLDSVTGLQHLTISGCNGLTDLNGLSALHDVGILRLEGNAGLLSLNGVPQLRTATRIELVSDPNLVDISALSVLEDANLWVYNLLYLTDFLPLRNVHLGSVTILNMPSLQSLAGLEGLGENAGVINVQNNAVLEDITALSGVRTAREIEIRDNASLRSLAGLEKLESVTNGSEIYRNALVPQCAVDTLHQRIPLLEGALNDRTATCM